MRLIRCTRRSSCGLFAGCKRVFAVSLSLLSVVLIASCDADLQALEEGILGSELQIRNIDIQTSGGQTANIVLNAGD